MTSTGPGGAGMFAADFEALSVGDAYTAPACEIGARDIAVFAALTGDSHPIHVDPEWAAAGPFGRQIAHGLLVLSCAVGTLPLDPERVVALRRLREAVFKRPVAAGESVITSCEVKRLRPVSDDEGLVECEWRIAGEDGRLRARAVVELLWRRGRGNLASRAVARAAPVAARSDELGPVGWREDGSLQVLV